MILGLQNLGKMKSHNGQQVVTRFLIIGIPLFPLMSYFMQEDDRGIEIDINGKSVAKAYLSWISLLLGVLLFAGGRSWFPLPSSVIGILGIFFLGLSIYSFFFFHRSTDKENEIRDMLDKVVGINALPEYLNYVTASSFMRKLVKALKENGDIEDWKESIKQNSYNSEHIPLLFAITTYNKRLTPSAENTKFYERLLTEYRAMIAN
jgi:hypothetical protein